MVPRAPASRPGAGSHRGSPEPHVAGRTHRRPAEGIQCGGRWTHDEGFSPQLVVIHEEERDSNARLISYDRTHGDLRFVRQLRSAGTARTLGPSGGTARTGLHPGG